MSTDLIAETLAKHQATMVHEAGPDIALACECDDTYRTYAQHASHQAEAVREALTSDESVERVAAYLHADSCPMDYGESCDCGPYDREAEIAIRALIGEDS